MTRCDRTRAWAALQGHYQAHGRDFDVREAFAHAHVPLCASDAVRTMPR